MKKEFQDKAAKKAYRKAMLALVRKYGSVRTHHTQHKKEVIDTVGHAVFTGVLGATSAVVSSTIFPPACLGVFLLFPSASYGKNAFYNNEKNKKHEWTTDRKQKVKGHINVAIALDVVERRLVIAADDRLFNKKTGEFYEDNETPEQAVKRFKGELDFLVTAVEVIDGSGPYKKPEISKNSTLKRHRFKI